MRHLQQLFDAAFDKAPASEANVAIFRVRDEMTERLGAQAWSYEVLLPAQGGADYLVQHTLPRLIYFLNSRGSAIGGEIFLSLFAGDDLHFIAVPDALPILSDWSGLSLEEMNRRWAEGIGPAPKA